MDFNTIDWDSLWQAESGNSHFNKGAQKELWNKRAGSFSERINRVMDGKEDLDKDDYISKMLEKIEVKPVWSVLDIGCGPGTLTIPLAKKAKSVTALDISSEMLKHVRSNALKNKLTNICYINAAYQDAFKENLVEKVDVVVASRSMMSVDMRATLTKVGELARQAAYITFPVVHLPFDYEVYEAIGRSGKKHPPYIYVLNMLFQMGIEANVEVLHSKVKVQFASIEEAIDQVQWRTEPFTEPETVKL